MERARKNRRQASRQDVLPCGRPRPAHPSGSDQDSKIILNSLNQKLAAFALSRGLNRSKQRGHILEVIVREARHFSVPTLAKKVQRVFPNIGTATIYRNLPVLVEANIIQESLTTPQGETLYELCGADHHDHIVCMNCGTIFEFHDEVIEQKQVHVTKTLGFTPRHHRHVIYAECTQLRKA